jgi:chemosensory pili system protein ChpA (sensor histidine kinase/response regulator)
MEHEEAVVEAAPEPEVPEAVTDAAVEIARIDADRDIQTAKIYAKGNDEDTAALLAAMAARIEILEAERTPPEPEPEPVVIVADPPPEPEPEPEPGPAGDLPEAPKEEKRTGKKSPWWG